MTNSNIQIGTEVVRSKGDYVVGRVGIVIAIDAEKNRAQVKWNGCAISKVALASIELTSIPYEIKPATETKDRFGYYKFTYPKYVKL
jgi:hypothetical protein